MQKKENSSALISVIIPAYNAEKVLPRCLDSLICQTWPAWEVLVVNDGSKDRTEEICRAYAKENPGIRLLAQKNAGPSAARNNGLEQARGKYISFVDSDDWVEPDYLKTLVQTREEGGPDICMSVCGIDRDSSRDGVTCPPPKPGKLTCAQALEGILYADGIYAHVWNKLYDASLIRKEKIRFHQDLYMCEDLVFNTEYLIAAGVGANVCEKQLYHYLPVPSGAIMGQYGKKSGARKYASEFEAVCFAGERMKASPDIFDENVSRAWKARTAKAAVNTLRYMASGGISDPDLKKRLMRSVRGNLMSYLKNPRNPQSSKLSVLMACISPKTEYKFWKMRLQG